MNGAEYLSASLLENDIDVCFANPGTSEMHFVAALDQQSKMRCILGLFEGVVTGAADGYARMSGKPAATLLHLGSGLSNGGANLHNARRARSQIVNIIGDHATHHLKYDAPLTSDIASIAGAVSDHVETASSPAQLRSTIEGCLQATLASPGHVSSLILPADVAWQPANTNKLAKPVVPIPRIADAQRLDDIIHTLRSGAGCTLLLGGKALTGRALLYAYNIGLHTGAQLLAETSNPRISRGAGFPAIRKLPYPIDHALETLSSVRNLVLVGARSPVAFFAYPGKPSILSPEGCNETILAEPHEDIEGTLEALLSRLGIDDLTHPPTDARPALPHAQSDALYSEEVCRAIAALLPEHAIVVDESITQGRSFYGHSHASATHDYLQLTGGAIGIGLPLATGASVACPTRQVVSLQGDGSGMYTVQALWTQAREKLKCLTIIFSNRSYSILHGEMRNVGVETLGENAHRMLDLNDPALDWVKLANGMGVAGGKAENISQFIDLFREGIKHDGPYLIEAVV